MKKLIFTLLTGVALLTMNVSSASAQDYKNAIGGRFGAANGISFKTGLSKAAMLELILNFRNGNGAEYFNLTGLYEVYQPISGASGLNFYYGAGATVGSYKVKSSEGEAYLSANGVLGLDYKFNDVPFNLSIDWIPALRLTQNKGFYAGDVGLGIRYTF